MSRPRTRAAGPELLVLSRWEDFCGWFLAHTARWPKSVRFTLTQRLQNHALDVLEGLVTCRYEAEGRPQRLRALNLVLERMRFLLRAARAQRIASPRGFESAMRGLDEAGRMLHDVIELAVEHRSAAAPEPIALDLCSDDDDGPYLRTRNAAATEMAGGRPTLADRILHALRTTAAPRKLDDLRAEVRCRMQSLVDALRELATGGAVRRVDGGWQIAERADAENPGETEMGSVEAQPVEG